MLVLKEALISCTLTEATLRQGLMNDSGDASDSLAEQAVLDAVVALLEANAFRSSQTTMFSSSFASMYLRPFYCQTLINV